MGSNTDDYFLHRSTDIRVEVCWWTKYRCSVGLCSSPWTKKTLRDADDNDPVDSQTLDQLLSGINRDDFRDRFGISADLVSEVKHCQGCGDLGEILFAAGAGVGQLRQLREQFELDAAELLPPGRQRHGLMQQSKA